MVRSRCPKKWACDNAKPLSSQSPLGGTSKALPMPTRRSKECTKGRIWCLVSRWYHVCVTQETSKQETAHNNQATQKHKHPQKNKQTVVRTLCTATHRGANAPSIPHPFKPKALAVYMCVYKYVYIYKCVYTYHKCIYRWNLLPIAYCLLFPLWLYVAAWRAIHIVVVTKDGSHR